MSAENKELYIGNFKLPSRIVAAPMAGVTDRPFRNLCRSFGAGLAASEMLTSDARLWHTPKSQRRMDHHGEVSPVCVQIAGANPAMMAVAARRCVALGAQIVDINMGCPVKKVCSAMAGSALLEDEMLVGEILDAVVAACAVPVTLKIRTGPDPCRRNGRQIAKIAENAGIAALAVHGRTRSDRFRGDAEYETIAEICQAVSIPVLANGDIDGPEKALQVLHKTGAAGVMIGRAAQGNPWIFTDINAYLEDGTLPAQRTPDQVGKVVLKHLVDLHRFYGDYMGVRVARKHIGWYLARQTNGNAMRRRLMPVDDPGQQLDMLSNYFEDPETALLAA